VDLGKKLVSWLAANDKINFAHQTPLSDEAVAVLAAEKGRQGMIGDAWVFPSERTAGKPIPRETTS
jgi:hypothetical protein